MYGNSDPMEADAVKSERPGHKRILMIMALLGVAASILTGTFYSARFGLGILVGSALAFGNYYWLKHSLQWVFAEAEKGERPKISALRYILRYLAMAAIIAVFYVSGVLPVIAVILGLCGFAFAVVIDGVVRIFSGVPDAKVDQ